MARLTRQQQKVFALNASNNGVFGSGADGSKILSNNIVTLQSKPAWLTGWLDAVLGTKKFPPIEEFQALDYITTYQIAYLFQEGIPEYDSATTYYEKSIVRKSGTYEIYGSKINNNTGNALPAQTDDANWEYLQDLNFQVADATTSVKGIAMLATIADVRANDTAKIVTPDLLSQFGFRTGDFKGTTGSSLQSGWVWAAGTIGNASSNATNRANADCEELFKFYWNDAAYNYTGSTATGAALQVYNSSGVAVAKGVSAAADWAANRQIAVFDMQDRVPAGRGNMVGNAGRLSGQPGGVNGNTLGAAGGLETHSLTEVQNGPHLHKLWNEGINAGQGSNIYVGNDVNGDAPPTPIHANAQYNTSTSGDGDPHNNVQPTIICNYIIKL